MIAILCIGSNREFESEDHDRKTPALPFGEQVLVNGKQDKWGVEQGEYKIMALSPAMDIRQVASFIFIDKQNSLVNE